MFERFSTEFGETPQSSGLVNGSGVLIEILVSPSGTWSIFSISPTGMACLVASGTEWRGAGESVPGCGA